MSDGNALVAAACVAPSDDLPRGALADWLKENGEGEVAALLTADLVRRAWALADRLGRRPDLFLLKAVALVLDRIPAATPAVVTRPVPAPDRGLPHGEPLSPWAEYIRRGLGRPKFRDDAEYVPTRVWCATVGTIN